MAEQHLALLDAAIAHHGPDGLVTELRVCVQLAQRERAIFVLSAMVRIADVNDKVALSRAGAAPIIIDALAARPRDELVVSAGLCALSRCSEDESDAQTTRLVVQSAIDAIGRHANLMVHQAALRLLKRHALGNHNLMMAPEVIEAVLHATRAFPADDTVQFWAAQAAIGFCSIEPHQVVSTHGQSGFDRLSQAAIAIAVAAPRPVEFLIRGQPWTEVIFTLYPRLRSQTQAPAAQ